MRLFRRTTEKPDYERIARLECELGLDPGSVDAERARLRQKPRSFPKGIILSSRSMPLESFVVQPGRRLLVDDQSSVRMLSASSSFLPHLYAVAPLGSRVELPPGVRVHA